MSKKKNKKICATCEREYDIKQFYAADKRFYSDGRLHICRNCALDTIEKHGFEGVKGILRMINKPILSNLYEGDFGDYVRQINSLPQYRSLDYEDSDMFNEIKAISASRKIIPKELSEEELEESEMFWGKGFTEEEYIWLNTEYFDFLNKYEVDTKSMEVLIREICFTQLDIRNRRSNNESVDKQLKTLQDLLGSSNLKPNQETGANSVEQETFGTLIRKWENERPIPEPLEEWKDVDKVGRYIRAFFLGHLTRMLGKKNKYENEYWEEVNKYTVVSEEDEKRKQDEE